MFSALRSIDLEIRAGELVAIVGKSGSGKSTLLNMLGGIDRPSSGSVAVGGKAIQDWIENQLAAWRGRTVGFVFQFFQLLPTLTAAENVILPMDFCRMLPVRERRKRALDLLERFGVRQQADKLPSSLSGGEQQRVAFARQPSARYYHSLRYGLHPFELAARLNFQFALSANKSFQILEFVESRGYINAAFLRTRGKELRRMAARKCFKCQEHRCVPPLVRS